MKAWIRLVPFVAGILVTAIAASPAPLQAGENPNPPEETVKLIFIHHSTGENWLTDGYGDLGQTLDQNNYFVSDTNYGWGPDAIGDRTDIPNWTEWFGGEGTPTYMDALLNESGQYSSRPPKLERRHRLTFYFRAARAGQLFDVDLYSGPDEARETYLYTEVRCEQKTMA